MKEKKVLKVILCTLGFGTILTIVFFLWYMHEPMIEGRYEKLQSIEIVYYTSVLYGECESIVVVDKDEMELIYNTIKKTSVEKVQYDREWGGESPEWMISLHFEDGDEYFDNGVSNGYIAYGVHKLFYKGEMQGVITGSNEELYLLIDETIEKYTGKIYSREEGGYIL